jgi:cysteinyl-tRNA synthetase
MCRTSPTWAISWTRVRIASSWAPQREQMHPMELAETYTRRYFRDMDRLNVLRPDISPRATGHIPEMIEWIESLIEGGHAYEANGSVYFRSAAMPSMASSRAGAWKRPRAAPASRSRGKARPEDFALWKKAEPEHIMRWNSPWGEGFPGWHIECTVMSTKYLGQPFDIHGGGVENKFPHHECEIAQAEA